MNHCKSLFSRISIKEGITFILSTLLLMYSIPPLFAFAKDNENTLDFFIDAVNATRWADTSVVYFGRDSTEQNEWGHNVVVNSNNKVIELIEGGELKGKNLPIPDGGMVVSATGNKVSWLMDNISLDDFVFYDNISSRIIVSKTGSVSPFFYKEHSITGFNEIRYENTFIIYDEIGNTGTNAYGYEVIVNSDGIIVSVGGNNNAVPENGFVVSAVSGIDKEFLKMYGILGVSVEISSDKSKIFFTYDENNLKNSIEHRLNEVEQKLADAKDAYKVISYSKIEESIQWLRNKISIDGITLEERNILFKEIGDIEYSISEEIPTEVRGMWHAPIEKTAQDVSKVVSRIKSAGINQLILCISNGQDAIMPLPDHFPFKQKLSLLGVNILESYVEECKKANIELIVSVAVYRNSLGDKTKKPEWVTKSNFLYTEKVNETIEDESEYFFSPANNEFNQYLKDYIVHILENYAIDGLQLDYIRYPGTQTGIDYGYDNETMSKFIDSLSLDIDAMTDLAKQTNKHELWDDWIQFKAELVTTTVSSLRIISTTLRPDIFLSAAVASDTKLSYYCQDIAKWVDDSLLDAIYPMTYGEGVLQGRFSAFAKLSNDFTYLIMGSGSYLNLSDSEIYDQAEFSRYFSDGICYFEYLSYFQHGSGDFLANNLYKNRAISPTLYSVEATKAQLDFMMHRIEEVIMPLGVISFEEVAEIKDIVENLKKYPDVITFDSSFSAIKAIIDSTDANEVIVADLMKAKKIIILSKDKEKAAYNELKNNQNGDFDSSDSEESISKSEPKIIHWGFYIFGIGVLFMIVVAVIILIRTKRRSS